MRKQITICVILMNVYNLCYSQDIHFSQFNLSPLLLNPGAAGNFYGNQRAVVNYKDQWSSIANPYRTYALAFDMQAFKQKWSKGFLGLGLLVIKDEAGDTKMGTTQTNFSVSYQAFLNDNHSLSAGLQGGFAQRKINSDAMHWGNQDDGVNGYDPSLSSGEPNTLDNFTYGDFGAGMMWNYKSDNMNNSSNDAFAADLGASLSHVNQPKGSFYEGFKEKLFSKFIVHGDVIYGIKSTNISIQPSFLYQNQGPSHEIIMGLMGRYKLSDESKYTNLKKGVAVSLGGYFRTSDAFVPAFLFEYAQFGLGFSYDINVSGLKSASNGQGGIEISLRYINPNPFKKQTSSKPGPSFF